MNHIVKETEKLAHEEEYFFRRNQELVEQQHAAQDAERRQAAAELQKELHWRHCPHCGAVMQEESVAAVKLERCTACAGVFLDKAEAEQLIAGLLAARKSLFARLKERRLAKYGQVSAGGSKRS